MKDTMKSAIRADRQLIVPRGPKPERVIAKTLGQLTDEMIHAFGTEDGERTRIAVLLRMGLSVSR